MLEKQLIKLTEECGELNQIVGKTLLHGINSTNPDTGEYNFDLLYKEMTDVISSILVVSEKLSINLGIDVNNPNIKERIDKMGRLYG